MGNDKAGAMRSLIIILFAMLMSTGLVAKSCEEYEADYEKATYIMEEQGQISYRKSYDLINNLINSATQYLAYCGDTIILSNQYQIIQVIKRADKKRQDYFQGAVREYHAIYGIRPNVTEIYQDGSVWYGPSRGTPGYSSPPRFPAVQQPQMPPVQH